MIFESAPWKGEVLQIANKLECRYNQKRWTKQSYFLLEKELFLGFFCLRKLMESNKVSTELQEEKIELAVYPAGEKPITLLNQHKFPELYNLYKGDRELISYLNVCNQFIHSSIFAPFTPSGQSLVGVYIASDWAKKKKLYYITLVKIIEMFRSVGNNYPERFDIQYHDKKKKYVVTSS